MQVFADSPVDNPVSAGEILADVLNDFDQKATRQTQKQRHPAIIRTACRVLEAFTLRYRLMYAAWQSEVLSDGYRKIANEAEYVLFFNPFSTDSFRQNTPV